MRTQKKLDILVPALALEHPHNPEFANLRDKIGAALQRYQKTGNFMDLSHFDGPPAYYFIQDMKLIEEPLGYRVTASCG